MKAIRIFLLILIIIGVGLLLTQNMWVPKLVDRIIQAETVSSQHNIVSSDAQLRPRTIRSASSSQKAVSEKNIGRGGIKVYVDTNLGFAFQYPSEYQDMGVGHFSASPNNSDGPMFSVAIVPNRVGRDFQSYLTTVREESTKYGDGETEKILGSIHGVEFCDVHQDYLCTFHFTLNDKIIVLDGWLGDILNSLSTVRIGTKGVEKMYSNKELGIQFYYPIEYLKIDENHFTTTPDGDGPSFQITATSSVSDQNFQSYVKSWLNSLGDDDYVQTKKTHGNFSGVEICNAHNDWPWCSFIFISKGYGVVIFGDFSEWIGTIKQI